MTLADAMDGRCKHCGGRLTTWTPAAILGACRAWAKTHGGPPTARDWSRSAPEHPANVTVSHVFGSWNAMIVAAGFEPRTAPPSTWTPERVIEAMLDWTLKHGRWPTFRDWLHAKDGYPCAATVRAIFGSWNEGRRAAGYNGPERAKLRTRGRRSRLEPVAA